MWTFWKLWLTKLWVKLKWSFVQTIEVKPFLTIDPNAYCPVCGHRQGRIGAITDGTKTNVRHQCAVCGWLWDEATVTEIDPQSIVQGKGEFPETEEEQPEDPREQPRFVMIQREDVKVGPKKEGIGQRKDDQKVK